MTEPENEFEKSVNNPHDAAFKSAFQKRELAESFFRNYLPERIRRHIDFTHLEITNKSYVDEKLREKHSDIVYKTKINGQPAFLYILFEHQTSPDPVMVFRLLCYIVNIWKEHIDQNPKEKCLPVIFPAVLYHGKRKWNSARTLANLIAGDEVFSEYIPDFTYELYDLGDFKDEILLLGSHMALNVVLYLFKHIFDPDFSEILGQAIRLLQKIEDQSVFSELAEWLIRYTFHARNEDEETIKVRKL